MAKIVGICNLHDGPYLGGLTERRPLAANTFLGRYGLMDFAMSNFTNSHISQIGILVEKKGTSIHDHIKDGHAWIPNTKTGDIRFFTNEETFADVKFNTDISNILSNRDYFVYTDADYFVFTPPFFLMSFDFRPLIKAHVESGRDITLAYTHSNNAEANFKNCDGLELNPDGTVKDFYRIAARKRVADISLETFVISKCALLSLCELSKEVSILYSLRKMIKHVCANQQMSIATYRFDGVVYPILSLQDYVRHSMDLLKYENRQKLFLDDWPIYTISHNTPPVLYGPKAVVQNSFIANGSIIKGTVINSIISRDVVVKEGAVVKNSILFTHTKVGQGVKINHVLADKQVKILNSSELSGEENEILYIKKGVIV